MRQAREGDPCPAAAPPWRSNGASSGARFQAGHQILQGHDATYLDANGQEQLIIMGCYGIGTGRTVAAAIEQNHDEPASSGPCLSLLRSGGPAASGPRRSGHGRDGSALAGLRKQGLDVLFDDRDERAASSSRTPT